MDFLGNLPNLATTAMKDRSIREWKCEHNILTVLKLGKRLSGEEPLTLRGRMCFSSSWGCNGRPGSGRDVSKGLPWIGLPVRTGNKN